MVSILKKHTAYHNGRDRAVVQMHDDLLLQIKTISLILINADIYTDELCKKFKWDEPDEL